MSYVAGVPFTAEEITLINSSGLTIGEVSDFWSRFPDQELDTAIGGCLLEIRTKNAGLTPGLEADRVVNPDVPAPAEEGPEVAQEATEPVEAPVAAEPVVEASEAPVEAPVEVSEAEGEPAASLGEAPPETKE